MSHTDSKSVAAVQAGISRPAPKAHPSRLRLTPTSSPAWCLAGIPCFEFGVLLVLVLEAMWEFEDEDENEEETTLAVFGQPQN
jgi:hypothetical protein